MRQACQYRGITDGGSAVTSLLRVQPGYRRLVTASDEEVYAGEYLPCESKLPLTVTTKELTTPSTSQCRDVDCRQAFGEARSGWSLKEWRSSASGGCSRPLRQIQAEVDVNCRNQAIA